MSADDEDLPSELREIRRALDREVHLDTESLPEEQGTAERLTTPGRVQRYAERALLVLMSVSTIGLGIRFCAHDCPGYPASDTKFPGPTLPATADDAGGPAAPKQSTNDEANEAPDECPRARTEEERAGDDVWVHMHLELRATPDESEPRGAPIAWRAAIPERLEPYFPAVSRDGRTVVQLYQHESADIVDDEVTSLAFFSASTGKRVAGYVLDSTHDRRDLGTNLAPEVLLEKRERGRVAANRILDATEWRRLPSSRTPARPCPGTPWEELDAQRRDREDWSWERVARFDDEGVDLEYDPASNRVTIRILQEDGTFSTAVTPSGFVQPCGYPASSFGGAFGSRSLGVFFVISDGFSLPCPVGGNGCMLPSIADRTSALRLQPKRP